MIKSDNGMVMVHGRREDILTDLAILLRGLREGGAAITDDEIAECVKVSKMTDEEVDADTPTEDVAKQISEVVAKTIREMVDKKKAE